MRHAPAVVRLKPASTASISISRWPTGLTAPALQCWMAAIWKVALLSLQFLQQERDCGLLRTTSAWLIDQPKDSQTQIVPDLLVLGLRLPQHDNQVRPRSNRIINKPVYCHATRIPRRIFVGTLVSLTRNLVLHLRPVVVESLDRRAGNERRAGMSHISRSTLRMPLRIRVLNHVQQCAHCESLCLASFVISRRNYEAFPRPHRITIRVEQLLDPHRVRIHG